MRAGQLRDRVRFDAPVAPTTAYVSGAEARATAQEAWAKIEALGVRDGGEEVIGDRLVEVRGVKITVRWTTTLAALNAASRVTDLRDNTVYNIKLIQDPDRRRERLVIIADQGRPGEAFIAPATTTAGQPIGLLLVLTKAA